MSDELLVVLKLKGKPLREGIIEDWVVSDYFGSNVVYGIHVWNDGHFTSIRTSAPIVLHENDTLLETRNSVYRLGKRNEMPLVTKE